MGAPRPVRWRLGVQPALLALASGHRMALSDSAAERHLAPDQATHAGAIGATVRTGRMTSVATG